MSAIVVAVGGAVWAYSQGAATAVANDYIDEVFDLMEESAERFTIEHVDIEDSNTLLKVWVYNYGVYNITIDTYATNETTTWTSDPQNPTEIEANGLTCINITVAVSNGDDIAIKVHSRKQNNAYEIFYVSTE
jgi:hypothetical protein